MYINQGRYWKTNGCRDEEHGNKNQETENKNWRNYRENRNNLEDFVNNTIRLYGHVLRMNKDGSPKVLNMKLWVKGKYNSLSLFVIEKHDLFHMPWYKTSDLPSLCFLSCRTSPYQQSAWSVLSNIFMWKTKDTVTFCKENRLKVPSCLHVCSSSNI